VKGIIKVIRGLLTIVNPRKLRRSRTGLHQAFGIAFYPVGPDPTFISVANKDSSSKSHIEKGRVLSFED
jgi:hypothetical protein